jgi:hypothetical protein
MEKSAKIDKIERKKIETNPANNKNSTQDVNSTGTGAIQKKRSSIKAIKSSCSMKSSDTGEKKSDIFLFRQFLTTFFSCQNLPRTWQS